MKFDLTVAEALVSLIKAMGGNADWIVDEPSGRCVVISDVEHSSLIENAGQILGYI